LRGIQRTPRTVVLQLLAAQGFVLHHLGRPVVRPAARWRRLTRQRWLRRNAALTLKAIEALARGTCIARGVRLLALRTLQLLLLQLLLQLLTLATRPLLLARFRHGWRGGSEERQESQSEMSCVAQIEPLFPWKLLWKRRSGAS
jgi:hypothetical protein